MIWTVRSRGTESASTQRRASFCGWFSENEKSSERRGETSTNELIAEFSHKDRQSRWNRAFAETEATGWTLLRIWSEFASHPEIKDTRTVTGSHVDANYCSILLDNSEIQTVPKITPTRLDSYVHFSILFFLRSVLSETFCIVRRAQKFPQPRIFFALPFKSNI